MSTGPMTKDVVAAAAASWVEAAKKLLAARTGLDERDLHYRAYLRSVIRGDESHSTHMAKNFAGAKEAMRDLIDEWGTNGKTAGGQMKLEDQYTMLPKAVQAKFEEGKSVDVPKYLEEHGNPEAAKEWVEQNEANRDNFKKAAETVALSPEGYKAVSKALEGWEGEPDWNHVITHANSRKEMDAKHVKTVVADMTKYLQSWSTYAKSNGWDASAKKNLIHAKSILEAKLSGKTASMVDTIHAGDRVTIMTPQGQQATGRAVMRGPSGWVLNMGGPHGRPGIASDSNIFKVSPSKNPQRSLRASDVQYRKINDAANLTGNVLYRPGQCKIWYWKQQFGRDFLMGTNSNAPMPTPATIEATHVMLGSISARTAKEAFYLMQGENWSPEGEANTLIRVSGTGHTSMSVGDIVELNGVLWMVDRMGFKALLDEDPQQGRVASPQTMEYGEKIKSSYKAWLFLTAFGIDLSDEAPFMAALERAVRSTTQGAISVRMRLIEDGVLLVYWNYDSMAIDAYDASHMLQGAYLIAAKAVGFTNIKQSSHASTVRRFVKKAKLACGDDMPDWGETLDEGATMADWEEGHVVPDVHHDDEWGSELPGDEMGRSAKVLSRNDSLARLQELEKKHGGETPEYFDAAIKEVKDGVIAPAAVVGGGYKDGKKQALNWLTRRKEDKGKAKDKTASDLDGVMAELDHMAEGCPDNLDAEGCDKWEANTDKYQDVVKDQHKAASRTRLTWGRSASDEPAKEEPKDEPKEGKTAAGNGAVNKAFLGKVDSKTKVAILGSIAKHYGISVKDAEEEVTDPQAEHLLEYLTGPERAATSLLMKRHASEYRLGLDHGAPEGDVTAVTLKAAAPSTVQGWLEWED